jgi:hypothetical protein
VVVDVLVDALGSIDRRVEVTQDPNEAFDAVLGPFRRRRLLCVMWLDDDGEDRAVFWQLPCLQGSCYASSMTVLCIINGSRAARRFGPSHSLVVRVATVSQASSAASAS